MKIFESFVQNCFFFHSKVVIFEFDCTANQFLSFGERQLGNFGEDFSQTHRGSLHAVEGFLGAFNERVNRYLLSVNGQITRRHHFIVSR
jgi:hypothetical protein